jgi:ankyrin repeat protein
MNSRQFMTSRNMKLALVLLCVGALKFRHTLTMIGATGAPWFQQNLTFEAVRNALNNTPERIDVINEADGKTGLMYAVDLGYREIAQEFIKRGASLNMNAKNGEKADDNERISGNTALHFAVLNADDRKKNGANPLDLINDLIKGVKKDDGTMSKVADVWVTNNFGFTPLHTAAASIESPELRMEVIDALVGAAGKNRWEQEGYLNMQNKAGMTILHILAQTNRQETIRDIIKKYGTELKFDIKDYKTDHEAAQTAAELAKASGNGTATATRLEVMQQKYLDAMQKENDESLKPEDRAKAEEDYKKIDMIADIPAA